MEPMDIEFNDIFNDLTEKEYNEFGLRRQMRFISERIIAEYCPSDCLSTREIIHPMAPYRVEEPFFVHNLTDKSKNEYVTALDLHDHSTYFPYAKSSGDIMLARYISNFNDINFTKISGQILCSFPGETVHGLRIGRMDRAMLAVNHRTGTAPDSTVTVIDLVKPERTIAYYDSPDPINTIDWIWGGVYYLAIGDDKSFRVADVRCPKSVKSVFFNNGVKKTALALQRQGEIACWDGEYVSLYDYRRPDMPCNIYDIGLKENESVLDMRFNPYITKELFVHTNQRRVVALQVNPASCVTEWQETEPEFDQWQIVTFKHIDRGCTSSRYNVERKGKMPFEEVEVPLLDYYNQFEASKSDPDIPMPMTWRHPSDIDEDDLSKVDDMNEIDFESYLMKAVERASAELAYTIIPPKVLYEAFDVETYDFVLPGVNGIMCFMRQDFDYKIALSPKHYEGDLFREGGADSAYFYRGIQIQEMIPAQTFLMFIDRLERGWNAYMTSEKTLKKLAMKITHKNRSFWSRWLRQSVKIQYGKKEYTTIGNRGLTWEQMTPLMSGPLPVVELPPYEEPKDKEAAEEVCQMVAPFFRLFLPNPQSDLPSESKKVKRTPAPPFNPYAHPPEPHQEFPLSLSQEMRTLCKCHAKIRYYNKKKNERKYMYCPTGNTFFLAASQRIREKFWRLGWKSVTKKEILGHRLTVDARITRKSIVQDLNKFQRFTPREFQKRVLPPKMITSSSVLMKPEYIKEREEKEREMREKAAQKPEAPIGLSVAKRPGEKSVSNAAAQELIEQAKREEDPDRKKFLLRAAMQLADNDPDKKPEEKKKPPIEYKGPASQRPRELTQAMGTRGKDDFEYETAEDAFFGIKKKRMYVVYKPATVPLGLKRYKPDRLLESNMIRRLEHLVYWGARRHERKILYGKYEESDKRQSTVKERQTLDFKRAFNAHKKVAWQTFYDKYFFFSDKFSYNQILRKAIQMYNIICHDYHQKPSFYVKQERMLFGIKPNFIASCSMMEAFELRTNCTMLEATISRYNQFMKFLKMEVPYQIDHETHVDTFERVERPFKTVELQLRKPTAEYDEDTEHLFPTGRLRFFELEIPPDIMEEVYENRKLAPRKKMKCYYLEEYLLPSAVKADEHSFQKSNSCPDLRMNYPFVESREYDDVIYTEGARGMMRQELDSQKATESYIFDVISDEFICEDKMNTCNQPRYASRLLLQRLNYMKTPVFMEWDSPMIADTDRKTKEKFMRRVVPYPEPQPPRQIHGIDFFFDFIPLEIRQAAMGNTVITWCYYDPALLIYPGIQCLDANHDQMYTLCLKTPLKFGKQKKKTDAVVDEKGGDELTQYLNCHSGVKFSNCDSYTHVFAATDDSRLWSIVPQRIARKPITPVFEQHSIAIPIYLMELLKPTFSGSFIDDFTSRYSIRQVSEMRSKRELQQEILTRRMIRFRQPVIEETEHELRMEEMENINMEEDDLKTTSEESEEDEVESEEAREQRVAKERRHIVKEVLETVLELVEDSDNARRAREEEAALAALARLEEEAKQLESEEVVEQEDTSNEEVVESQPENDQSESQATEENVVYVPESPTSPTSKALAANKSVRFAKDSSKSTDSSSEEDIPPARRKYGYALPIYGYIPNYNGYARFNPHTRANIQKMAEKEDATLCLTKVLNEVYHEDMIEERMAGGEPRPGTPELAVSGPRPILGPIMSLVPQPLSMRWELPIDQQVEEEDRVPLFPVNQLELDADYIRKLYKQQFNRRVRSSDNLQSFLTKGKFKKGKLPRRASMEYFQPKTKSAVCSACIEEPWPTKEMCIVCHPNTAVYRCSNIVNLQIACNVCGANIYKFSCKNYEAHVQQIRKMTVRFEKATRKPTAPDEKLRAYLASRVKSVQNDLTVPSGERVYRVGDDILLDSLTTGKDNVFHSGHQMQLSKLIRRDFHYVCWQMDEEKSERVVISEEFAVAFDRDADVDLMRDTMNTISQDGEMDMMTTYDQKTGMRVRRWISFSALNTRLQKQAEKKKRRQRTAEREAKILAGEINAKPGVLAELQKKMKDKEEAVKKAQEADAQKLTEEQTKDLNLWKKLPIPDYIEEPKKTMPDPPPPKKEDWLESSGSEDELPPIRSRIQSPEVKEFIANIRAHMARKPDTFNGLRVTYGKLFEKRPILKNDIVLVTKRQNLKKKPPPYRIQRIPLDDTWLNDSLRVSFLPVPTQLGFYRDSKKWTVPFYSSEKLELSDTDLRNRAFRPPTPPMSIAAEYKTMKALERAYFSHQTMKKLWSMKKVRAIRQVRFRQKLVGFGMKTAGRAVKCSGKHRKTWKTALRELNIWKQMRRDSQPSRQSRKRNQPQCVVSYFPNKKKGQPKRLGQREKSRPSSDSDSDNCPTVKISRRQLVKKTFKPKREHGVRKLLTKKIKPSIKKVTPQFIAPVVTSSLRKPETGQLCKRVVDPNEEKKLVSRIPVNYGTTRRCARMAMEKSKRHSVAQIPKKTTSNQKKNVSTPRSANPLRQRLARSIIAKKTTSTMTSAAVEVQSTKTIEEETVPPIKSETAMPEPTTSVAVIVPAAPSTPTVEVVPTVPPVLTVPRRRRYKSETRRRKKTRRNLFAVRSLSLDCEMRSSDIRWLVRSAEKKLKQPFPMIPPFEPNKENVSKPELTIDSQPKKRSAVKKEPTSRTGNRKPELLTSDVKKLETLKKPYVANESTTLKPSGEPTSFRKLTKLKVLKETASENLPSPSTANVPKKVRITTFAEPLVSSKKHEPSGKPKDSKASVKSGILKKPQTTSFSVPGTSTAPVISKRKISTKKKSVTVPETKMEDGRKPTPAMKKRVPARKTKSSAPLSQKASKSIDFSQKTVKPTTRVVRRSALPKKIFKTSRPAFKNRMLLKIVPRQKTKSAKRRSSHRRPRRLPQLLFSSSDSGCSEDLPEIHQFRVKRFSKKQKVLHNNPTRSRVLNAVRTISGKQDKCEILKYAEPIDSKLSDMQTNPWIPLKTCLSKPRAEKQVIIEKHLWKLMKRKSDARKTRLEKRMRRAMKRRAVAIKRIIQRKRVDMLKKFRMTIGPETEKKNSVKHAKLVQTKSEAEQRKLILKMVQKKVMSSAEKKMTLPKTDQETKSRPEQRNVIPRSFSDQSMRRSEQRKPMPKAEPLKPISRAETEIAMSRAASKKTIPRAVTEMAMPRPEQRRPMPRAKLERPIRRGDQTKKLSRAEPRKAIPRAETETAILRAGPSRFIPRATTELKIAKPQPKKMIPEKMQKKLLLDLNKRKMQEKTAPGTKKMKATSGKQQKKLVMKIVMKKKRVRSAQTKSPQEQSKPKLRRKLPRKSFWVKSSKKKQVRKPVLPSLTKRPKLLHQKRRKRVEKAVIIKPKIQQPAVSKSEKYQPMSWKRKLKTMDGMVKIKRIRAGIHQKKEMDVDNSVDDEEFLEVVAAPTVNLKSCMKFGLSRRTLKLGSEKKEQSFGFGGGFLMRPVRSATPLAEPPQPKPCHTEPSLLRYQAGTDPKTSNQTHSPDDPRIHGEILTSASQVFPLKDEIAKKQAAPLRILKPVPISEPDESKTFLSTLGDKKGESDKTQPERAPPPKLPADQQWRNALMARRNLGSSRPVAAPSKPPPKRDPPSEKPKEERRKKDYEKQGADMSEEEKSEQNKTDEEKVENTGERPEATSSCSTEPQESLLGPMPFATESNVNKGMFTIPTMTMLPIKPDPRRYVEPVAVPRPTVPPPSYFVENAKKTSKLLQEVAIKLESTVDEQAIEPMGAEVTPSVPQSNENQPSSSQPLTSQPTTSQPTTSQPTISQPAPPRKQSFLDKLRSSISSVVGKSPANAIPVTGPIVYLPTAVTRMPPPQASAAKTIPTQKPKSPKTSPLNKTTPQPAPKSSSSPSTASTSKSPQAPESSQAVAQPTDNSDLPLLPRVRRPETGQLIKKLPPNTPKPPVPIGPIVKFVGGKPITNSPNYRKPLSRREPPPPPPPPPPPLSSSSSEEEDLSMYVNTLGECPTTSSPEFFEDCQDHPPPLFITEKQRLAEEEKRLLKLAAEKKAREKEATDKEDAEKLTSVLKTTEGSDLDKQTGAGKSVTFGPTYSIDPSPPYVAPPPPPIPPPPPAVKPEDQKHIFHQDLPDALKNETPEEHRKRLGLPEPEKLPTEDTTSSQTSTVVPSTSATEQPAARENETPPISKPNRSFFFKIQPFGKITPKAEKKSVTTEVSQPPVAAPEVSQPSTSEMESSEPCEPSTSGPLMTTEPHQVGPSSSSSAAGPVPSHFIADFQPGTSSSQPKPIPVRKPSTRRQLRMDDPSPLQLSGDASLPKPAEFMPEKPLQLDPPKPVENYNPVSQRRYYTKFGQEWKPQKTRRRSEDSGGNSPGSSQVNTPSLGKESEQTKKPKKRIKKKTPPPGEPTLVLDGMNHFSKLTAENLKLLDREYDIQYMEGTFSIQADDDGEETTTYLKPERLKNAYRDFRKGMDDVEESEEMVTPCVIFNPAVDNDIVKVEEVQGKKVKYETAGMKVKRMMRERKQRIKAASKIVPSSKRSSAIMAARQVQKVRFFQTHKKQMMPPLSYDFEPKSILKPPKPPVAWRYRIDFEGNKIYMRSFGPSRWQQRMDQKTSEAVNIQKRKPKAMQSYLKCWTKMMSGIGKHKLSLLSEKEKAELNADIVLQPERDVKPDDVLVPQPNFGILAPTPSLSSMSVSSEEEAPCSVLGLISRKRSESASSAPVQRPPVVTALTSRPTSASRSSTATIQGRPRRSSSTHRETTVDAQHLKQFPLVYLGMTVGRSPSNSTSMVNDMDAVESVASDGSQIIEYQGHEVPEPQATRRRLDPFVRPLSALFKAFTSNAAPVSNEPQTRSRRMERNRLSQLFRRQSPPMPEFNPTRAQSSSPTRRRSNRPPPTSISQGSSAEDILALMKAQPDALRQMEQETKTLFPPLKLPEILPPGTPMFQKRKKLKKNKYTQMLKNKQKEIDSKIDADNDKLCKPGTLLNCTMIRKIINFNMDEYMRLNRYPKPSIDFALLGRYNKDSLRIQGKSQAGCNKAVSMIVKKLDQCRERMEKAKKNLQATSDEIFTDDELTVKARDAIQTVRKKKHRKIRVQYKFKKTCVKYRVEVVVAKKPQKKRDSSEVQEANAKEEASLRADEQAKAEAARISRPETFRGLPPPPRAFSAPRQLAIQPKVATATNAAKSLESAEKIVQHLQVENVVKQETRKETVMQVDYDGDDDGESENQEDGDGCFWSNSKRTMSRENQRKKFLRHYFEFSVRMARKVARRSVGNKNPILFYSFISQVKTRMRQFMQLRQKDVKHRLNRNSTTALEANRRKLKKNRHTPHRKWMSRCLSVRKPNIIRHSLKYGNTVKKEVVINHSKFAMLKKHARLETFFQCLDEYIDVGTPIKLVFRSCNTLLPKKLFEVKSKQVDTDIYTSPSPVNTDSDYSTDTPENPRLTYDKKFFEKESLESTYRVKGLPGLIYLARLVQERIGDDVERNLPFSGPALEYSKQVVFVSPIRRLMLISVGLVMPDRVHRIKMGSKKHDKFDLWFGRLFKMVCYGRGDMCRYVISKLCRAQGPPRKNYDKMDIHYQAYVTNKLFKKMIYLNDGKEANLAIRELMEGGLDLDIENPYAVPFKADRYDQLIFEDDPWSRDDWMEACDMFLSYAKEREDISITCQASILVLRMLFCGGCSQDIVDELITFKIPLRYKLLFIINLTPPEHLVENIIKLFNMVRGLDRLPFVGLGYHADSMQVLFDEAVESGDPQLIAHIIRIGRCLDRRSGENMMTDTNSKHINNRDHAQIMTDIFTNGKEKWPCGAPTMDEVFPYRYVRDDDGSKFTRTTEELAQLMECEVTRYMAILELTKGSAIAKGDLDHNKKFFRFPSRFYHEVICTGCKMNVHLSRSLGRLGRVLCVSTMPMIEQDKDKKRWPLTKRLTPRSTYDDYIETLDPTENKMLMSKDVEEEKTDITVQILPSRFGCFNCRFELPRCAVCMCSFLNDHMDFALQDHNESYSQFAVCNICNHGGHVNHIALWFKREKVCPVNGCDCKCQPLKRVRNLKKRLHRHMMLSVNMRAKSHLCNPACAVEVDIDEGFLPDPDIELFKNC